MQVHNCWLLLIFLIKINDIYCDAIDEAKNQAEKLELLVNGTQMSVKSDVSEQYLGIMYSGMYAEEDGQIAIRNQRLTAQERITEVITLGETSGTDISSCVQDYEIYLDNLQNKTFTTLGTCISLRISESTKALTNSDSMVDKFYTRIAELKSEINNCDGPGCISSIVNYMNKQEDLMPEKIKMELIRIKDLYDILRLTMSSCRDNNIAEFSFNTTLFVNEIVDCANNLIG